MIRAVGAVGILVLLELSEILELLEILLMLEIFVLLEFLSSVALIVDFAAFYIFLMV